MILYDFVLIAAITSRSQAYLQAMIKAETYPSLCILYTDKPDLELECNSVLDAPGSEQPFFNLSEPLIYSLKKANIPYLTVNTREINSHEMLTTIQNLKQQYLIYSGYGGSILKPHLFHLGKKFIHIHAGLLPQYRGSTTAYYSVLQDNLLGASSIFLSEGIDEGDVLLTCSFKLPEESVNIDYVYEPYIRSEVLLKTINLYLQTGTLNGIKQEHEEEETYFIIHPVLKHLAMKKIENAQMKGKNI